MSLKIGGDKVAGFLSIGTNDKHEIVMNCPSIELDADGVGFFVFSINQARNLAKVLCLKADEAEAERATHGEVYSTSGITIREKLTS